MSAKGTLKNPLSEEAESRDVIARGEYTSAPVGKALYILLHGLDPVLQYSIFAHGFGTSLFFRVGLRTIPSGPPASTSIAIIDNLGLSPYRLVLLSMSIGIAVRRNTWITTLSRDPMPVVGAISMAGFNTFYNALNSYVFMLSASSASAEANFPQPAVIVGSGVYAVGILTELVSEMQRYRFKSDPKNEGKLYTEGLFHFVRHTNYSGYFMWRVGYAIAGGGFSLVALVAAFAFFDMSTRAVPVLNEYCERRYGGLWEKFKQDTPCRPLRFIY